MLIHCGTIQSHTHADRVKRKKLPFTSNESFSKHFQYRREYNSFKIMSSCFNSVFHNFKSFRNYADISYVNAPYQMHVFSFILFLSLPPSPRSPSLFLSALYVGLHVCNKSVGLNGSRTHVARYSGTNSWVQNFTIFIIWEWTCTRSVAFVCFETTFSIWFRLQTNSFVFAYIVWCCYACHSIVSDEIFVVVVSLTARFSVPMCVWVCHSDFWL